MSKPSNRIIGGSLTSTFLGAVQNAKYGMRRLLTGGKSGEVEDYIEKVRRTKVYIEEPDGVFTFPPISLYASVPPIKPPEWFAPHLADALLIDDPKNSSLSYKSRSKLGIPMLQKETLNYFSKMGFNVEGCLPFFTESVHQALWAVTDNYLKRKDEILITLPTFGLFFDALHYRGCNIKLTNLSPEDDFKLTPHVLKNMLEESPKARLLIFINPDNPTGKSYSEEELRALAKILVDHNRKLQAKGHPPLIVFSDEVSKNINLTGKDEPHLSIGAYPGMEKFTLTVHSASKILAPGLGIAFSVGPKELVHAITTSRFDQMISDFGPIQPVQYALAKTMELHEKDLMKHTKEISKHCIGNLQTMERMMDELNQKMSLEFGNPSKSFFATVTKPDGGLQILVKFPGLMGFKEPDSKTAIDSDLELARLFKRSVGIKMLPGQTCGFSPEEGVCRITLSKDHETFKEGMLRIHSACQKLVPFDSKKVVQGASVNDDSKQPPPAVQKLGSAAKPLINEERSSTRQ